MMQQSTQPPTTKRPRTLSHSRPRQQPNIDTPADLLPFPAADINSPNIATQVVSYHAGGGYVGLVDHEDQNPQQMQYDLNQQLYGRQADAAPFALDSHNAPPAHGTASDFKPNLTYQSTGTPQLNYAANQQQSRPTNRTAMIEQAGGPGFMFNAAGTPAGTTTRTNPFSPADISNPSSPASSFHHIENLDRFFTRVYRYHQRGGFWCMVLQELLEIVQYVFVVCFSVFLLRCVNYPVLFRDKPPPTWWYSYSTSNTTSNNSNRTVTEKVRLSDAVIPAAVCLSNLPFVLVVTLLVAVVYLLFRAARFCSHLVEHAQTQLFYQQALGIPSDADLQDYTWYEVLQKMLHAQRHHQMSVHKAELTELDVYQRILRVENYMIALLNKAVVPAEITVPLKLPFSSSNSSTPPLTLLTFMYIPRLYELNIEWLLFRGYASPFVDRCSLREEYKQLDERARLIDRMQERITWLAIGSFLLSPLLFVWQCLYLLFSYGELLKRDPGVLGARTWSSYGKWYVRHFNELEHELRARLNRAYSPANEYMSIFVSPLVTTIARNLVFFAGSMLVVLVGLTVWDEDVITVEHVITLITGLGVIVAVGRAMMPDENLVWNPQQLMTSILAQIHYMPDGWTEQAHKTAVRDQVANLFQFKLVFLLLELWSPFLTPFVLFFSLRKRAPAIVDFLRDYTDEVVGVGDVCSFALMDVRRHGRREWMPTTAADEIVAADRKSSVNSPARTSMEVAQLGVSTHNELEREIYAATTSGENDEQLLDSDAVGKSNFGKTELSLIHFKLLNPKWRPTGKHNQRYLELVLRKCLQNPSGAYDQAPALRLSALVQQQQQHDAFHQSIYGGLNTSNHYGVPDLMRNSMTSSQQYNAAAAFRGRQRFEGAPAHELARYISSGGAGSTSEHSTSSSGMSDMSNSAHPNAAAALGSFNMTTNSAYASTGEPLLRSLLSGNGGGLPLDFTAHAMSTSVLQVHSAHLRRTRSNHQTPATMHEPGIYGQSTSSAFARSYTTDTASHAADWFQPNVNNTDDRMMTKANISVVPRVEENSNLTAQSQAADDGTGLNFSVTATAGSVHPWAQSFKRWFPMRIIAGPVGHRARAEERAPLVVDDISMQAGTRGDRSGIV